MTGQSLYALIDLALRLVTLLFLLRFLLQAADADRFNPLSQAVVKGSDPFTRPLRKLLPNLGRWDLASLLLAWAMGVLFVYVVTLGSADPVQALAVGAVRTGLVWVQFYWWSILVIVVVSFINQGSYHPVIGLLDQLLNPIMAPLRNILPTMGPLDFSPLVALIILSLLQDTLQLIVPVTMTAQDDNSVGLVSPELFRYEQPFTLQNGAVLQGFDLVYETYGELNQDASNAVLICHALSGHHHAAGYYVDEQKPGWWEHCIGPGKAMDTNKLFIISLNNLGGCHGSTGPETINPSTGKTYGPEFPQVVVKDWVASQALLAEHLNIECFLAVVGGSLGGMQALQWSIDFPERTRNAVLIATAAKLTAQNIAFNEIARQAITSDPEYKAGPLSR
jgi:uncharacterized protein YggT (Ycf19 family)